MSTRTQTRLFHEGRYVAEVEVELITDDSEWAPYLSLEEAYRLDDIREALKKGDFESIKGQARIYELHPVAI